MSAQPGDVEEAAARVRAVKLLELRAEELYRALLPHSRKIATGVLSSLLLSAEHLREGRMIEEGDDAVDINLVFDAGLGRTIAELYLQAHRERPPLRENSPQLVKGQLRQLLLALQDAERESANEVHAVVAALTPELESWLALAAEQAISSADPAEAQLWIGRTPLEVAVELLVIALRRLLRETGGVR